MEAAKFGSKLKIDGCKYDIFFLSAKRGSFARVLFEVRRNCLFLLSIDGRMFLEAAALQGHDTPMVGGREEEGGWNVNDQK